MQQNYLLPVLSCSLSCQFAAIFRLIIIVQQFVRHYIVRWKNTSIWSISTLSPLVYWYYFHFSYHSPLCCIAGSFKIPGVTRDILVMCGGRLVNLTSCTCSHFRLSIFCFPSANSVDNFLSKTAIVTFILPNKVLEEKPDVDFIIISIVTKVVSLRIHWFSSIDFIAMHRVSWCSIALLFHLKPWEVHRINFILIKIICSIMTRCW